MDVISSWQALCWPLGILLAWFTGEYFVRRVSLSRISVYAILGFVLAPSQLGWFQVKEFDSILLLANMAFGLILFECGHRINLRWLLINRWLAVSSLIESLLTFLAVWQFGLWLNMPQTPSLLLAALSIATSPATLLSIINAGRCSGQVSERAMHLSALNSVLAVFAFKIILGLLVFRTFGSVWQAAYNSFLVLAISAAIGVMFGMLLPALLRVCVRAQQDSTMPFALAVICVVALTNSLQLSPILSTLVFGLVTRHYRLVLSPSERGFGILGKFLSVLLFVFIASTLEWSLIKTSLLTGGLLVLVRGAAKVSGVALFSRISGTNWRKGVLVGLAMMPNSAFVILLLQQDRHIGLQLVEQLAPLAAAALLLEIVSPLLVELALHLARELPMGRRA
ncbi:cation:proton antiporter [Vogesella sp. LIG4]|uniref:cation:proton antiporter n=1 Tax=Vogesella sp. LIG4 TaxID=1192162 RepID=UPI00081FB4A3|nr:cation:proton antiporter [Vogesella sp. LIG4]SCK26602.1 transporter, CPA2 family [Vogesella sp. LIG4]